jgi:hypothetical protein
MRGWPNTSVEPTAYAASFPVVMDSLFMFTVSSARLPRLWLTSIR